MKQTAIRAAKEAGKILMKYYGKGVKGKVKFEDNLVSKVDLEAEKKIISVIKSKYPNHSILSEECGEKKKDSDYMWIIDPLDGTHNFLAGLNMFGTCIALKHKQEVILGVIFLPYFGQLYVAEKGKGAFLNGKKMHVSKNSNLNDSMILYDGGLRRDRHVKLKAIDLLMDKVFRLRILGAACVNFAYLAKGDADAYIEHSTNPWDIAAGMLIVQEAGGKVTNRAGEAHSLGNEGFVASNGKIHKELIDLTKRS